MKLLTDEQLEESAVVANCRMNRERNLRGSNGYDRELHCDPLEFLKDVLQKQDAATWLDLCCGTGKALIEAASEIRRDSLPIAIVGVDLVGMFDISSASELTLVEASLSRWQPEFKFDLITCVHGLHYVGDKLGLIERSHSWLEQDGSFVVNLDCENLKMKNGTSSQVIDSIRKTGLSYSMRNRLLRSDGIRNIQFPFDYLGADPNAGPNYTGQPAVNSWYR